MPSYEQDEQAFENFNKFKTKISQNRLIIISAVNLLTFALSIFSISYYKWVYVDILNLQQKTTVDQDDYSNQIWVNLLYGKQINQSQYQSFQSLKKELCSETDASCQALFIEFRFVGLLSFFMFAGSYILQIIDFYQLFRYIRASSIKSRQSINYKSSLEVKDSFMHLVTILSYSIGLGLNFFSLTLMNLKNYEYGISFWTFFSSLIIFVLCIIYKNISINKIAQRSLMLNLIEGQKKLRKQQLIENSRLSGQSSDFQI